jgi:hypothetical protein
MNPLGWRPLKDAQDYYRYLNAGANWIEPYRSTPSIGSSVYVILRPLDNPNAPLKTSDKIRGYLSDDGWRYIDGRPIDPLFEVGLWMYDEASRGCVII